MLVVYAWKNNSHVPVDSSTPSNGHIEIFISHSHSNIFLFPDTNNEHAVCHNVCYIRAVGLAWHAASACKPWPLSIRTQDDVMPHLQGVHIYLIQINFVRITVEDGSI